MEKSTKSGTNTEFEIPIGSILAYTDRPLHIVEWDVMDGYQIYYPFGVAQSDPIPLPTNDFQRYESQDPLITLRINTITPNQTYSLVLDQPQGKEWESTVAEMTYNPGSDTLTGETPRYWVDGHIGSQGNGTVEFTFKHETDSGSVLLIGHVRV